MKWPYHLDTYMTEKWTASLGNKPPEMTHCARKHNTCKQDALLWGCRFVNSLKNPMRLFFFFTNRLSGKNLYQLTTHVIAEVEKCGLQVVRIVTDNHKINVTMMRHLGNGSLKPVVTQPSNAKRKLFLSFDQRHILKNIQSLFMEGDMTDRMLPITEKFVKPLSSYVLPPLSSYCFV